MFSVETYMPTESILQRWKEELSNAECFNCTDSLYTITVLFVYIYIYIYISHVDDKYEQD